MRTETALVCDNCGFTAPADDDAWRTVDHPPLGKLTQCPECGSTNVHNRG
jgi:predicted RNA-binding Zn-ribbon protein involved in translation (DUF1610 family)